MNAVTNIVGIAGKLPQGVVDARAAERAVTNSDPFAAPEPEDLFASSQYQIPPNEEDKKKTLSTYKAVIDDQTRGIPADQSWNESQNKTSGELVIEIVDNYKNDTLADLERLLQQTIDEGTPEDIAPFYSEATQYGRKVVEKAEAPTGPETAVVEAVSRLYGPDATDIEKRVANQLYFNRQMHELVSDQDIKDWAVNVGGLLLLSDQSLDINRVVGDDGMFDATVSYFSSAENWAEVVSNFQTLSPEQQVHDFNILKEQILEATDNNELKTAIWLSELIDPASTPAAAIEQFVDKVSLAGDLTIIGGIIARARKAANVVAIAKKLDNVEAAAKTASTSVGDAKVAEVAGITPLEAAATASPFKMEDFLEGAPDGLSKNIQTNFETLNQYLNLDNIYRPGVVLNEEDKLRVVADYRKKLESNPNIDNIEVLDIGENGFRMKYEIKTGTGKAVRVTEKERAFTIDDVTGTFSTTETGFGASTFRYVTSPNFLFNSDRKNLVNDPERLLRQTAALQTKFKTAFKQVFKGLNKESSEKVSAVLARGRDTEQVYTYNQLVGGGVLTEKEFKAYANVRFLMDKALAFKNKEIYDTYRARGYKEIDLGYGLEVMKPANDITAGVAMLGRSEAKIAYVPDKGGLVVKLDSDDLAGYYDRGYVLATTTGKDWLRLPDGNFSELALVKRDNVKNLPEVMLGRRPGYMPRQYKDGIYFVKHAKRATIGDSTHIVGVKTLRYFDSKKDADLFAEQLRTQGIVDEATGELLEVDPSDIRVMHDREMAVDDFNNDTINIFGGLYTSPRGAEELKFGLEGTIGDKVDPLEAMSRYFDNIAQRYPISLYRLGLEQTWFNTAKAKWGLPKQYSGSLEDAINHLKKDLSITEMTAAKKSHMQIMLQMRTPTSAERAMQTYLRTLAEKIETGQLLPAWKGVRTAESGVRRWTSRQLHRLDHRDPVNAMLASSFHAVMGFFNPAPILVQGSGATIAMSRDPVNAPKHLAQTFALSQLDLMLNPRALDINAGIIGGKIGHLMGWENGAPFLKDLKKAWDMSGFAESIKVANPDYAALSRGHMYDRSLIRRVFDQHTWAYKTGEMFNYRYNFTAAFDWWRKQPSNRRRPIDQRAVSEISARAESYLLHMSRANKAAYQTGFARIPAQFMRIFAAYTEAVLGKELTTYDKAKLLIGQTVLFGTAAVPFADDLVDWISEQFGTDKTDMTEEQKDKARAGLVQHLIHTYLGADIEVATRASLGGGMAQLLKEVLVEGKGVGELAAGAFGGIIGRRGSEIAANIFNIAKVEDPFDSAEDLTKSKWLAAVNELATITSTWRAQDLAWEVHNNKLFKDRRGNILIRKDDLNVATEIGMRMGFQYSGLQKLYLAKIDDYEAQQRIQKKAEALVRTIDNMLRWTKGDVEEKREVVNLVFNSLLESETQEVQDRIRELALNKLTNPTTAEDRMAKKQLDDLINGLDSSNPLTPSLFEENQ